MERLVEWKEMCVYCPWTHRRSGGLSLAQKPPLPTPQDLIYMRQTYYLAYMHAMQTVQDGEEEAEDELTLQGDLRAHDLHSTSKDSILQLAFDRFLTFDPTCSGS